MLLFVFSILYTLNTATVSNDSVSDVSYLTVCLLQLGWGGVGFFVNVLLLEQKQMKQVAAISPLQKITLFLKLVFYGYFVVLVSSFIYYFIITVCVLGAMQYSALHL